MCNKIIYKDKITIPKIKLRDYSRFSADRLNYDLSQVDWNDIILNRGNDMDKIFSSFYNKCNKIVNKHAPMRAISQRKAKQLSKHG